MRAAAWEGERKREIEGVEDRRSMASPHCALAVHWLAHRSS